MILFKIVYSSYSCEATKKIKQSKRTISQTTEAAEMMKNRIMKAQNMFNTTAASSNHFKSTETSNSKHKRSKTHNSTNLKENDIAIILKTGKKEDALSQIKSEMKNLYEATEEGKYKFLPNRKIVYVTKSHVKKPNKRCSSTEGNYSQNKNYKKKTS